MSDSSYTITLVCSCGSDQFSGDMPRTNDTMLTCVKCGATGRYGDLMQQASDQITQQYADVIGNMFKKK